MTIPLLQTKLYIPLPRTELVPRPRLIERLNEGLHRTPGVTLISAPASFGKTTLAGSSAQCALCGALMKIRDLSLTLVEVKRMTNNQSQVKQTGGLKLRHKGYVNHNQRELYQPNKLKAS
jgi:hypothetical protein